MEEIEWENPLNPRLWTDSHHRKLALFTRYKTAAERAFHKSFRTVQMYFRDATKAEIDAFKAETMRMKVEAEIARTGGAVSSQPWSPPLRKPLTPLRHLNRPRTRKWRKFTNSLSRGQLASFRLRC